MCRPINLTGVQEERPRLWILQQLFSTSESSSMAQCSQYSSSSSSPPPCDCRYLHFVHAEQMVYLRDASGTVLSLPPLTNCDSSKVSIFPWYVGLPSDH